MGKDNNDTPVSAVFRQKASGFAMRWLDKVAPIDVSTDVGSLRSLASFENGGLNLFPEGAIDDVVPFGLPSVQQEAANIWAELKSEYNAVVSRFSKGLGTDVVAPDKASFRYASHAKGLVS